MCACKPDIYYDIAPDALNYVTAVDKLDPCKNF